MIRLRTVIPGILILFSEISFGQTAADANSLFETRNYQQAFEAYKNLTKQRPKDATYSFRYAYSAYQLNNKPVAIEYFKKSASKFPESNYYLGEMYFADYNFEEAATAYSNYLAKPVQDDSLISGIEKKQKQAEIGARFMNRVEDVQIIDSIVVDKNNFLKKIQLPLELGTLAQRQLLTEKGTVDNIRYTTQRGDRSYFSELINGQTDLFTAYKLLENWAEKTPLSDLNTDANENYPFLMLDGVTLYFASDGEGSMGGYDIFITRLNTSDNTFLKPENIGMPFNSPYNDYMMMIDELHKIGWFASDRFLPEGKVAIYRFIPNLEKKIIRTENRDSLINKAQIRDFTPITDKINLPKQTAEGRKTSENGKIYINDKTFYSDASEFKSNTARNNYYQMLKLTDELTASQKELVKLRTTYADTPNETKKIDIGGKILSLEARVRELKPQIEKLGLEMRNEEIKNNQ